MRRSGLQALEDLADVDSAQPEERFALLGVDAQFDEELVVDEEIAAAGDVQTDLPVTVFVGGKGCSKLYMA